jgi:hypothetical protein
LLSARAGAAGTITPSVTEAPIATTDAALEILRMPFLPFDYLIAEPID